MFAYVVFMYFVYGVLKLLRDDINVLCGNICRYTKIYMVYIPIHKSNPPFSAESISTLCMLRIPKEYHLDKPMDIFNRLYGGETPFLAVRVQNAVFQ